MKQIVLIKQSNSIQLAHLYEHIFCTQVDALFYDNGLFPHLDYKLTGRAYQRGVVYISVQSYTEEAETLASRISTLETPLNQDAISTAASQLIAEKEYAFDGQGYDAVKQTLEELDVQPWQNLDTTDIIDTIKVRRKAQPFYIAEELPLAARKLTVDVSLNVDFAVAHRDLLPLFRQLTLLASMTLQNVLSDKYGYYSKSDDYEENKQTVGISNIFKVPNGADVDIEDNLATCQKVIGDLQHHDAFSRLTNELSEISLYYEPDCAPNPENTFVNTGIIIGAEGWKRTATVENCELLLKNMSIEIKYGRDTSNRKSLFESSRWSQNQ